MFATRGRLELACANLIRGVPKDVISSIHSQPTALASPLELNALALGLLSTGEVDEAITIQQLVVDSFSKRIGGTSDAFLDIAGSINDLGCCLYVKKDYPTAEKQWKRALLMANRSHRLNLDLQSTLVSNLCSLYAKTGRVEEALSNADSVLQVLSKNSTLSPTLQNGALASQPDSPFYWSKVAYPSFRRAQMLLLAGSTIARLRHFEEGMVHINHAFAFMNGSMCHSATTSKASDNTTAHPSINNINGATFALPLALAHLAAVHDDSEVQRHVRVSANHIVHDHLYELTAAELCLTSPSATLKGYLLRTSTHAATATDTTSDTAAHTAIDMNGAPDDILVTGCAFLDIEAQLAFP